MAGEEKGGADRGSKVMNFSSGPSKKFLIVIVIIVAAVICIAAIAASGMLKKDNEENEAAEEPTFFTVSFDSHGGSAVPDQLVESGDKAEKPADPSRAGYSFVGWFVDAAGGAEFDFDATIDSDITVHAQWGSYSIVPSASAITYGQNLSGSTIGPASATLPNGTTVPGTWKWANGSLKPNAGAQQYSATFTPTDNSYSARSFNVTVTVNKATLTVTAADKSMLSKDAVPALTFTYSGFVNGDTAGNLTAVPTISTTANSTSPPGTYPITLSGGVSNNYAFVYNNGTMTVNQSAMIIIQHQWGDGSTYANEETFIIPPGTYNYSSSGLPWFGGGPWLAPGSAPAAGTVVAGETKTIIWQYLPV